MLLVTISSILLSVWLTTASNQQKHTTAHKELQSRSQSRSFFEIDETQRCTAEDLSECSTCPSDLGPGRTCTVQCSDGLCARLWTNDAIDNPQMSSSAHKEKEQLSRAKHASLRGLRAKKEKQQQKQSSLIIDDEKTCTSLNTKDCNQCPTNNDNVNVCSVFCYNGKCAMSMTFVKQSNLYGSKQEKQVQKRTGKDPSKPECISDDDLSNCLISCPPDMEEKYHLSCKLKCVVDEQKCITLVDSISVNDAKQEQKMQKMQKKEIEKQESPPQTTSLGKDPSKPECVSNDDLSNCKIECLPYFKELNMKCKLECVTDKQECIFVLDSVTTNDAKQESMKMQKMQKEGQDLKCSKNEDCPSTDCPKGYICTTECNTDDGLCYSMAKPGCTQDSDCPDINCPKSDEPGFRCWASCDDGKCNLKAVAMKKEKEEELEKNEENENENANGLLLLYTKLLTENLEKEHFRFDLILMVCVFGLVFTFINIFICFVCIKRGKFFSGNASNSKKMVVDHKPMLISSEIPNDEAQAEESEHLV